MNLEKAKVRIEERAAWSGLEAPSNTKEANDYLRDLCKARREFTEEEYPTEDYHKDLEAGATLLAHYEREARRAKASEETESTTLADHVLAMEGDAYLDGHPEWHEIVAHAKREKEAAA